MEIRALVIIVLTLKVYWVCIRTLGNNTKYSNSIIISEPNKNKK